MSKFCKNMIAIFLSIMCVVNVMPIANASQNSRPSIEDVYIIEDDTKSYSKAKKDLKKHWPELIEFMQFVEEKVDSKINWNDFIFQWEGKNLHVFSKYCDSRKYIYKKPKTSIDDFDYLVNLFANIIGNVELPDAPNGDQIWAMYVLLRRYHEFDGDFMSMYYYQDNYDTRNFDPDAKLTKRAVKNARKVLKDYFYSDDEDGNYSLNMPYQLYCQSRNIFGDLLAAWYNVKTDQYQFFSDGDKGDGEIFLEE